MNNSSERSVHKSTGVLMCEHRHRSDGGLCSLIFTVVFTRAGAHSEHQPASGAHDLFAFGAVQPEVHKKHREWRTRSRYKHQLVSNSAVCGR